MGKNDAWHSWEEVALAEAWLAVSQDSIVGRAQTSNDFFKRIAELMTSKLSGRAQPWQGRLFTAIRGHFNEMSREANKMSGLVNQLEAHLQSGQSPNDVLASAKDLYEKDSGKKFRYEAFWRVVRHAPKWQSHARVYKAHARLASRGESSHSHTMARSSLPLRPVGTKQARAVANQAEAARRLAAAAEVQNRQMRERMDLRLAAIRLEDYDEDARPAMQWQRAQALLRLSEAPAEVDSCNNDTDSDDHTGVSQVLQDGENSSTLGLGV